MHTKESKKKQPIDWHDAGSLLWLLNRGVLVFSGITAFFLCLFFGASLGIHSAKHSPHPSRAG